MKDERQRRSHILQVAERLLCHYGPQKTTIAEIARAAEVGVGTVYLEFPSKEAIVEELSLGRHAGVMAAMKKASRAGKTHADRLRAIFDARTKAFFAMEQEGAHARDLLHCGNPAVASAHQQFKEGERALIVDLLREGQAAGEISAAYALPVEETAAAVVLAYMSFAPPFVFGADRADIEKRLRAMHALVLSGLLARESSRERNSRAR